MGAVKTHHSVEKQRLSLYVIAGTAMTLEEVFNAWTARATPMPDDVRELSRYAAIRLVEDGAGPLTAVVAGELDLSCADALTAALCEAVGAHPAGLRLDLSEVAFCDCSTLRCFLDAQALAIAMGRGFAIGPHSQPVARVLELSDTRALLTAP